MNNMKKLYFGLVHNDADGFWLEFPDFDCCVTQGDSIEELTRNAAEVLELYIESMVEHGDIIPLPADSIEIQKKVAVCEEPVAFVIPVAVYPPQKTVRINITAPGDRIAKITDFAKNNHVSRSEFMINASISAIENKQQYA